MYVDLYMIIDVSIYNDSYRLYAGCRVAGFVSLLFCLLVLFLLMLHFVHKMCLLRSVLVLTSETSDDYIGH